MLQSKLTHTLCVFVLTLFTASSPVFAQESAPIRIGYWSSGFSLGFGAVLQAEKFLEKEGLEVEFREFSEVSAPAKAVLTDSIDIAFGAPAAAAFNLASQGAPVRVFLVTQILEGQFVVPTGSDVQSVEALRGKRIGMSRPGSSTHALVTTILDNNYDLAVNDYAIVPGNEGQLSQLLVRGDLDASSLRSVTIAQMPQDAVRPLFSIVEEWKKLTGDDTPPALAVAMAQQDFLDANPDRMKNVVRAIRKAVKFGSDHPDAVAEILQDRANMEAGAARRYAAVWDKGYMASLSAADIAGLKRENEIFVEAGAAEAMAPDALYVPGPYEAGTAQ